MPAQPPPTMQWSDFDWLLRAALAEDAADRDVTTCALVPEDAQAVADVRAREEGVICGVRLAARLAALLDDPPAFAAAVDDGARVPPGATLARLHGPARAILALERTMLNFLQQLSGVATLTARFVDAVAATGALIYDTRKTTPGFRTLQKYAVRCGGGCNHRMDLAGAVLIKDNHLELVRGRGLRWAVDRARAECPDLVIEVEVDNLEQLEQVLPARPDVVLLDNMAPDLVARAAELVARHGHADGRLLIEASGSITLANVAEYARSGADRIAVGALTHSTPALDIGLDLAA
jgi:nicotinate-nucleotide pyrophosphorylase (carboxylating)